MDPEEALKKLSEIAGRLRMSKPDPEAEIERLKRRNNRLRNALLEIIGNPLDGGLIAHNAFRFEREELEREEVAQAASGEGQ